MNTVPSAQPIVNLTPRISLELPRIGKIHSVFAAELGNKLASHEIFSRNGVVFILNAEKNALVQMSPELFRTWSEKYATFFIKKLNKEAHTFDPHVKTMTKGDAATILVSEQFTSRVREIEKVNHVSLPVLRGSGKIELLPVGYDAESKIYTSSELPLRTMEFGAAKQYIDGLLADFPFKDETSKGIAIAAMLTAFSSGLLPAGALKPLFLYDANAEGAGKTLLVKVAVVPVAGDCPLSAKPKNEDELRKALDSSCIAAKPFICFDNVKGELSSEALEGFLTSQTWRGRILGSSTMFECNNHAIVFITGNGCTVSSDLRRRALVCSLHSTAERAEERVFKQCLETPSLVHQRCEILGALWAFILHWDRRGRPTSSQGHASFPEWAKIIGGIVEAAGYSSPHARHTFGTSVDTDGEDMRKLVRLVFDKYQSQLVAFEAIATIAEEAQLFERCFASPALYDDRQKNAAFGKLLKRYDNRSIADWKLVIIGEGHSRRYRVEKETKS